MEDIIAIFLFDEYRAAEPQAHGACDPNRSQRLI